jgi:hypothetical protein
MKTTLAYVFAAAGLVSAVTHPRHKRATDGYIQVASGNASFTQYTGCSAPGEYMLSEDSRSL